MKDGIIIALVGIGVLAFFGFMFYADYSVCTEYFPNVNPIVCMVSGKTKVMGK